VLLVQDRFGLVLTGQKAMTKAGNGERRATANEGGGCEKSTMVGVI
jgi:hypothetical protein